MICSECTTLITEYFEGTLDDGTRVTFEQHLEICPGCAAYLDSIRFTVTALGETPEPADPHVREHLLQAYRAAKGS